MLVKLNGHVEREEKEAWERKDQPGNERKDKSQQIKCFFI